MSSKECRWDLPEKTYISQLDGQWYAYRADVEKDQVYGIGADNPRDGCLYCARWTDAGIRYVASPSTTRRAAYQKARKYGKYSGEI